MKILIVNDDGYAAKGLRILYEAAAARGHQVYVAAPSRQCSARGQCLTLFDPLPVHPILEQEGLKVVSVDGNPADCVRVAPQVFDVKFDVCLSGINHGENVGTAIFYSGTVSAAREGAMMYLPAIALSLHHKGCDAGLEEIARIGLDMAERIRLLPLKRFGVLNINAPAGEPSAWKGSVICPISEAYYLDGYEKRTNPFGMDYLWLDNSKGVNIEEHTAGSDADMVQKGYVTYTWVGGLYDWNEALTGLLPECQSPSPEV